MQKSILLLLIPALWFSSSSTINELESAIEITIDQNQKLTYQLPENEEDWFAMEFSFTILNTGQCAVKIVDPNAYKIFPQPWALKLNDRSSGKWSGSPMCAPSFVEEDKITIEPGESKEFEMYWSYFTQSFSRVPGKHELTIKYQLIQENTFTMGAESNDLTEVESDWSNTVEIEILK
jgi:hypothetical protein